MPRTPSIVAAVASVLLVASCGTGRPEAAARLDEIFAQCFREGEPGGAVCVTVAGRTLFRRAFGLARLDDATPVRAEDSFPVGSLTKQFTAAVVLRLADRGRVRLEDPVGRYVTGLPDAMAPVTLSQLLNQTSGIPEFVSDPAIAPRLSEPGDPRASVAAVAGRPLSFRPGSRWEYSNTNYVLLGLVIEAVTGRDCPSVFREEIFEPCRMEASSLGPPAAGRRVLGYERDGGALSPAMEIDPSWSFTAGGAWASVDDLAAWSLALESGDVLPREWYAVMTRPVAGGASPPYAMGWWVERAGRRSVEWHDGAVPGFYALLLHEPATRCTIAVVSNGGAHREDLARAVREAAEVLADS